MPRIALAALLLAIACSSRPSQQQEGASTAGSTTSDTVAAAAGVDSLMARFIDAYNRDDAKALAETYSEDVNFTLEGTLLQGRSAVEQGWKENLPALSELKITPVSRVLRGDVAVLTDRFQQQLKMPNAKTVTDSGYYLAL